MLICCCIPYDFKAYSFFPYTLKEYHQFWCQYRHLQPSTKEVLMIAQAFPKDYPRYLAVAVLGPIMDRYAAWLLEQQYTHRSTRYELRMATRAAEFLRQHRKIQHVENKRMGRVALQKVTSTLRNFLRFLAVDGKIPFGLEKQIDTPRVYRQEKLPRWAMLI